MGSRWRLLLCCSINTLLVAAPVLAQTTGSDQQSPVPGSPSQSAAVAAVHERGTAKSDIALNTFVQKCATGLGIFGSTAILSFAHFPAHAVAGAVPPAIINRLALTYVGSITSLYVGSGICIAFYRITRAQHMKNLQMLAERRSAAA